MRRWIFDDDIAGDYDMRSIVLQMVTMDIYSNVARRVAASRVDRSQLRSDWSDSSRCRTDRCTGQVMAIGGNCRETSAQTMDCRHAQICQSKQRRDQQTSEQLCRQTMVDVFQFRIYTTVWMCWPNMEKSLKFKRVGLARVMCIGFDVPSRYLNCHFCYSK